MSWQFFITLNILLSGGRNIFARKIGLGRKDLTVPGVYASFLGMGIAALLIIGFNGGVGHIDIYGNIDKLLISSFIYAFTNILVLRSHKYAEASVISIMMLLTRVSVVSYSVLVFGSESLSVQYVIGGLLLLIAAASSSLIVGKEHKWSWKAFRYILLTAILFGLAVNLEDQLISDMGLVNYVAVGIPIQIFWSTLFFMHWRIKSRTKLTRKDIKVLAVYALIFAGSGATFILTLNSSEAPSLPVLSGAAVTTLTMILSYVFLKEKDHILRKLSLVLVSTVGLVLLFT